MFGRLIPVLALLALPAFGAVSTSTKVICTTQVKSVRHIGAVPTTTVTKHMPNDVVIVRSTVHPTKVVTPAVSTITRTSVVTSTSTVTASLITDTFSTTSTIVSTILTTSTSTEIDIVGTVSTTTTTISTIIQPTASIVPIDQSSGDTNYAGSKRRGLNAHPHGDLVSRAQTNPFDFSKFNQPWAVSCMDYVQIHSTVTSTVAGSTITRTAAAPTRTVKTTSTTVSTLIVVPADVSTTISFSTISFSTITAAATTTTVVTTTSTVIATSIVSSYAACGTNNVLGPQKQDGSYVEFYYQYDNDAGFDRITLTSGYDCCVACLNTPGCEFSMVLDGNNCIVVKDTAQTCDPNYVAGALTGTSEPGFFAPQYVSNGYCGSVIDAPIP